MGPRQRNARPGRSVSSDTIIRKDHDEHGHDHERNAIYYKDWDTIIRGNGGLTVYGGKVKDEHLDLLAERIDQLGGKPDLNPEGILSRMPTTCMTLGQPRGQTHSLEMSGDSGIASPSISRAPR